MAINVRRGFAIALVLVAIMSTFVPVASATSETWYLSTDKAPSGAYILSKTIPVDGTATIPSADYNDWIAGPAQCSLTIGAGTWTLDLDYTAPSGGGTVYMSIWCIDGKPWTKVTSATRSLTVGTHTEIVSMTGISVDFESGDYILLYLEWTATDTGSLTVNCGDGDSTLKTPSSDPGFPVPELSSLALFSVGLLALGGYVVYRRRDI